MPDLVDRIPQLQEEIVIRVEAINRQKEDKKTIVASYNENIKALEKERDQLLQELNQTKEEIKRGELVEQADEILEANAQPGGADLSLLD